MDLDHIDLMGNYHKCFNYMNDPIYLLNFDDMYHNLLLVNIIDYYYVYMGMIFVILIDFWAYV
jgi:hypothetical protein